MIMKFNAKKELEIRQGHKKKDKYLFFNQITMLLNYNGFYRFDKYIIKCFFSNTVKINIFT